MIAVIGALTVLTELTGPTWSGDLVAECRPAEADRLVSQRIV